MEWSQSFSKENKPHIEDISRFINSGLFEDLCSHLSAEYGVSPQIEYSSCSMLKGWNIKYRKGARSLCVIYPMDGYFTVLVVTGERERDLADLISANFCDYVRSVYEKTQYFRGTKWLIIEVKDNDTLKDLKDLIALRAGKR